MEIFVDDETKLTLHGLQQYYVKLKDNEKNRKLFDLLDVLEFNQVYQCTLNSQTFKAPFPNLEPFSLHVLARVTRRTLEQQHEVSPPAN